MYKSYSHIDTNIYIESGVQYNSDAPHHTILSVIFRNNLYILNNFDISQHSRAAHNFRYLDFRVRLVSVCVYFRLQWNCNRCFCQILEGFIMIWHIVMIEMRKPFTHLAAKTNTPTKMHKPVQSSYSFSNNRKLKKIFVAFVCVRLEYSF